MLPLFALSCSRPVPLDAADPDFAAEISPSKIGERAFELTRELVELGPRDAGSAGARRAAEWIAGKLPAAEIDSWQEAGITFHNVESFPQAADFVLLISHFDTKSGIANFQGANDGASSAALLIALAEAKIPAAYALLDGEECRRNYSPTDGLHGSRRLAEKLRTAEKRPAAVILLDMIADRNWNLTIPRNCDKRLTLLTFDAASALGLRESVSLFRGEMIDDHVPFLNAGFPAIDLIDFDYPAWHTANDDTNHISAESLTKSASLVIEMLRRIAAEKSHAAK